MLFLLLNTGRIKPRPVDDPPPRTQVRQVMPGSGTVHENLLRFSIRFSKPPHVSVLQQLILVHSDGTAIEEPFLNQELWSPDGRILTVVMGPGRVKTGLIAHDTLGRPLHAGENVLLELDGRLIARWRVIDELIRPVQPSEWHFNRPRVQTRELLRVRFRDPIDGMDAPLIVVALNGHKLPGQVELSASQECWTFRPAQTWQPGQYHILIHPHLEDAYGNEVGSAFETPSSQSRHSERRPTDIPFSLR